VNKTQKWHDGRLDDQRDCHVFHSPVTTAYGVRDGIRIRSDWAWGEQIVELSTEQALSLLEWLKQERETLQKNIP
jgi:hypothetical protein